MLLRRSAETACVSQLVVWFYLCPSFLFQWRAQCRSMSLNILVTLKASYAIVSVWLLHSRIIFLSPVVFGAPSRAVLVLTVEGPHNFHVGAVTNIPDIGRAASSESVLA